MGQARRRGTFEERKDKAISRDGEKLADMLMQEETAPRKPMTTKGAVLSGIMAAMAMDTVNLRPELQPRALLFGGRHA